MKVTNVYKRTMEASLQYKLILEEGGSRSSKTWSIFQFFIIKSFNEKFTLTIAREKLTWIKTTLIKDFEELIDLYNLKVTPEININRQDQVYYLNGCEFAFFGLDNSEKLHGRKQHYTWINECMDINKKSFDQLEMRTSRQMILDYNPWNDDHWVFKLAKRPDCIVITSTQLDNPFNPLNVRNKILSYEPTEINIINGTADEYMWEVYGLGKKAKLQGAVFSNWSIVPEVPKDANFISYGLDFGYVNDPTCLIEFYMFNNEIYINELIYENRLTNPMIADRMIELKVNENEKVWADSAEPKSIEEISNLGFNLKSVEKGQDSIKFGVDILLSYKINITKNSTNIEKELRKYKWSENKTGKILNKPVDAFNHAIDAVRYVAMSELKQKQDYFVDSLSYY